MRRSLATAFLGLATCFLQSPLAAAPGTLSLKALSEKGLEDVLVTALERRGVIPAVP